MLNKNNTTFSLFFKHVVYVLKRTLRLSHRVHAMDVIAVKSFIKNEDRNIANTTKVDEILSWKREPGFDGMTNDYIKE